MRLPIKPPAVLKMPFVRPKSKSHWAGCGCGRAAGRPGFSLLELLVVLVLLGMMAAVAAPSTGRFLNTLDFRKQTGEVMAVLRYARLMAVTEGKILRLKMNEDEQGFLLEGAVSERRAFGLDDEDLLELQPEELFFYPEGNATPGSIKVTIGDRVQKIVIDPLTGLPLLDFDDEE